MSNNEALSLLQSECWQSQYLSLSLIQASLVLELNQSGANSNSLQSSSSSSKNPAGLSKAASVRSGKLQPSQEGNNAQKTSSTSTKSTTKQTSNLKKTLSKAKSILNEVTPLEAAGKDNVSRRALVVTPVKVSEELFHSGFLRSLAWLLVHRNYLIRLTASTVIRTTSF